MPAKSPEILFPVTINVDAEILASAIDSGLRSVRYWSREYRAKIPPRVKAKLTAPQRKLLENFGSVVFAALTPGCRVELLETYDDDADEAVERSFGPTEIARALGVIATKCPYHLRTILDGGDGDSGDVLIQLAALDDVVYG